MVHLGFAYEYFHHWSHAAAFEHVRRRSGVGEGISVSHAFSAMWAADVLWWWISPATRATRSPGMDRMMHGFMVFVTFNAAVVFEEGLMRWSGIIMISVLAVLWFWPGLGRTESDG